MKMLRHAAALLAMAAACQAVAADDYYSWANSNDQSVTTVGNQQVTTPAQSSCTNCEQLCNTNCCESGLAVVGFAGFDAFKGVSEAGLNDNFGAVTGLNASVPLFGLSEYGFGWQLGMSYGIYDFDGRDTLNTAASQEQTFITTGFFRKAPCGEHLSFGLVYDWMVNTDWGAYANDPTLGQWRGQVEWAVSDCNAFGVRGAVRDNTTRQTVVVAGIDYLVANRAVSHAECFWRHEFECTKAESFLWAGLTQNDRLTGDGSLSDWLLGASVEVPLSDRISLYANAEYVHPTAAAGPDASVDTCYDISMGITIYFGGRCCDCCETHCAGPYLPVANNSSFLVDQGVNRILR
jgi:hypothetical protein